MFGSAIKHVVKWRFKSKFPSWYGRLDTGILEKIRLPPSKYQTRENDSVPI